MACQTWLARGTESAFSFTLKILTSFTMLFVAAVCELIGPDGVLLFSVGCYLLCIFFAFCLHLVQHCQVTDSDTLSWVRSDQLDQFRSGWSLVVIKLRPEVSPFHV